MAQIKTLSQMFAVFEKVGAQPAPMTKDQRQKLKAMVDEALKVSSAD